MSSGVLFCNFSAMHECVTHLAGGPVWTHELGNKAFVDMLAADVKRQAPFLASINTEDVDGDNWRERLAAIQTAYPATVSLEPIPDYARTKGPLETLHEMIGDKPVIVI